MDQLLPISESAAQLPTSISSVLHRREKGRISAALRAHHRLLWDELEFDEWVREQRRETPPGRDWSLVRKGMPWES